jgi:hypothetical protein
VPALLETDPVCLARTADGDIDVPLRWARGLEAVVLGVTTRMRMVRGEWFQDRDAGVPWLPNDVVAADRAILGGKFNRARVDADLRAAIMSTPGVVEVLAMDIAFDGATRALTVAWKARAAWGDTAADTLTLGTP